MQAAEAVSYDLTSLYLIMQIVATSSICSNANARVPCGAKGTVSKSTFMRRITDAQCTQPARHRADTHF